MSTGSSAVSSDRVQGVAAEAPRSACGSMLFMCLQSVQWGNFHVSQQGKDKTVYIVPYFLLLIEPNLFCCAGGQNEPGCNAEAGVKLLLTFF